MMRLTLVALVALAVGCAEKDPTEAAEGAAKEDGDGRSGSFPGYDPPPLAELLEEAQKKQEPSANPEPFKPREVEVPPLEDPLAGDILELLPKVDGKPMFGGILGAMLTVDPALSDPITAMGVCLQRAANCLENEAKPGGRTPDDCMRSVPACSNNHPWDGDEECCSARCKELHAALREQGYGQMESFFLMTDSDCHPAVREFRQAAKDRDKQREAAKP
ncbi:MAG: hypothetical protein OXU20_23910 [Myxococcales bacterium]|nr:hypothetical protein [Myxococcales bacterium]